MGLAFLKSEAENSPLFNFFSKALERDRTPVLGQIEITRKCNFTCPFCYAKPIINKKETSTSETINIIDQVIDNGCLFLLLTGGEPLLHPEFEKIYERISGRGILLFLETNGFFINNKVIDIFDKHPPSHISISLYGATNDTYYSITGNKCYNIVIENIKRIIETGHSVSLRTPVSKLNFNDLERLHTISSNLNIPHSFNFHLFPKQNGEVVSKDIAFSTEELKAKTTNRKISPFTRSLIEKHISDTTKKPKTNCNEGINSFYINAYAELVQCTFYWNKIISLRKNSFNEAWQQMSKNLIKHNNKWQCKEVFTYGYCRYWDNTLMHTT